MKENNTYFYSYSAQENNEIKRIRDKYTEPDKKDSPLEQLRRLDASVHNKAAALSLAIGIIGALVLGFGLSCILVWSGKMFVTGIVFGIAGIVITAVAYPVYKIRFKKLHKKIAPLILKITDELIK